MNDINNWRQNHPELIVRDLNQWDVPAASVRHILKFRGINKWLRVRRLLIALKARWLQQLTLLQREERDARRNSEWKRAEFLRGQRKMLTGCRQQLRALCHSPRDVDFPNSPRSFGPFCDLPGDFPAQPNKRWFWRSDQRLPRA